MLFNLFFLLPFCLIELLLKGKLSQRKFCKTETKMQENVFGALPACPAERGGHSSAPLALWAHPAHSLPAASLPAASCVALTLPNSAVVRSAAQNPPGAFWGEVWIPQNGGAQGKLPFCLLPHIVPPPGSPGRSREQLWAVGAPNLALLSHAEGWGGTQPRAARSCGRGGTGAPPCRSPSGYFPPFCYVAEKF